MGEHCFINPSRGWQNFHKVFFVAFIVLFPIKEEYLIWGNQLLQSPSPTDPSAVPQTCRDIIRWAEVGQVEITDARVFIPLKHGVDGFRELKKKAVA